LLEPRGPASRAPLPPCDAWPYTPGTEVRANDAYAPHAVGDLHSADTAAAVCLLVAASFRPTYSVESWRDGTVETITVTLDLPKYATQSSTVRALEAARDAQADPTAKQALAMAAALASRGLVETLARSLNPARDKRNQSAA